MRKANYPRGGCDSWDLSKFDMDTLEYEVELCTENLYGVWLPEYNTGLKGFLNETAADRGVDQDTFDRAVMVWKERLRKVQDELFERVALVKS